VSAGDAQQIFGAIFGGSCADPVPPLLGIREGESDDGSMGRENVIWVATERYDRETVVSILIDNETREIDAFTLDLEYPVNRIRLEDCFEGFLDPGWIWFECSEISPGLIRMAGFSLADWDGSVISQGSYGSLVELVFIMDESLENRLLEREFKLSGLQDDLDKFDVR